MTRPLRIEFADAVYHVTARGNAQATIYHDDDDRERFLRYFAATIKRHEWVCHAYCLMGNHYHLLLETAAPNLSKGMKWLNGAYAQSYNRKYHRAGHLFQGRFKAILVQKEAYLLELARYIVLNPVRARMVRNADGWPWSSFRATAGYAPRAPFLCTDWLLANFGRTRKTACTRYREFVGKGRGQPSPWERLQNGIYLGDDRFIKEAQQHVGADQPLEDVSRQHRLAPRKPLAEYAACHADRGEAMAYAYASGHYTLAQVGAHFDVSCATVSRAVKKWECKV